MKMKIQRGISRLAIDVGNVISISVDTDEKEEMRSKGRPFHLTSEESARSLVGATLDDATPTMECTTAVRKLVELFGRDNTYILSKCKRPTQRKTVQFLQRPFGGDAKNFLERTGLKLGNVLFCTRRSGGVHSEEDDGLVMEDLDVDGMITTTTRARTAVGDVGKGAVARDFAITHMIDDREECLLSVMFEGRQQELSYDNGSNSGALIHFGPEARIPSEGKVKDFINGHAQSIPRDKRRKAVEECQDRWIVANGLYDVLEAFDTTEPRLRPKIPPCWNDLSDDQKKVYENLVQIINKLSADAKYNAIPDSFDGRVIGTDAARELSDEYEASWEGSCCTRWSRPHPRLRTRRIGSSARLPQIRAIITGILSREGKFWS